MRTGLSRFGALCLVALLGLVFAIQVGAQQKKAKMYNVQGNVQNLDKGKMSMTVRTSTVPKDVVYSADTKFMVGHSKDNKPGTVDDVKENYFISCEGTYNAGKPPLMAKMCVYRETK